MLEHADARDLVVERLSGQIAIVHQFHAHPIAKPGLFDALARDLQLLRTKSDALGVHPIVLGGVDDERSPSATDVEEFLPRPQ